MSCIRKRLEARLIALGWRILERHFLRAETGTVEAERWVLESARTPSKVKVEVEVKAGVFHRLSTGISM